MVFLNSEGGERATRKRRNCLHKGVWVPDDCYLTITDILIIASTMTSLLPSSTAAGQIPTQSSNFTSILDAALSEYKRTTGKGLLEYPLATEVKQCDSIGAISAILQGQAREFRRFRDGDQRLMKLINPVVEVLSKFSDTLGGVASMVRS